MEIDAIEKHFVGSRDSMHDLPKFTPPNFTHGVSQEEKEALPKGVVIVDSEPDIPKAKVEVLNCDVEDILIRGMKSSAQSNTTPLPPGASSRILVANFLLLFDGSKRHYGCTLFSTTIT